MNNELRTISVESAVLSPFEFTSGYTLRCFDLTDDGIKIELNYRNESAAILLPPETADEFDKWLKTRMFKGFDCKIKKQQLIAQLKNDKGKAVLSHSAARKLNAVERALEGLEGLYELIEDDTGVTAAQLKSCGCKKPPIVEARAVCCFILHLRYGLKIQAIARIINAKSHATPLLALRKFSTERISYEFYERAEMRKCYMDAKKRYKQTKCKVN